MDKYDQWLNYPSLDSRLRDELLAMDEDTRHDAFYTSLTFGTAGMRGILGAGSNRMNIYTIRKATSGLAEFILKRGPRACESGVAIAYDNRYMSKEFAYEAARVLAKHNIKSYVFESLRPTPELSFAVRHLKCFGGIVITASHNPKEYNGYKIYDANGCQMIPEYVDEMLPYFALYDNPLSIDVDLRPGQEHLITVIGKEVDEAYYAAVKTVQINPDLDKRGLKIIFTPQHGTAMRAVKTIFEQLGYNHVVVAEQSYPDPAFSNTRSPNPERVEAYELALKYAKKHNADIVLTTDPDADRIGVAVKQDHDYVLMTGNQTGAVLLEYVFSQYRSHDIMPADPVMFNTIVTGDLGEKVASAYGVTTEKTLTGFKYIGDRIAHYEQTGEKQFVFGYEESYGYLIKPFVRDKDAMQAALIIAEAAVYYKQRGQSLLDVLETLYERYGRYNESQVSIVGNGDSGAKMIRAIMNGLRKERPTAIAHLPVARYEDYQTSRAYQDGCELKLTLPEADVLKYFLSDGSWIAVRPSGTEPKCKFYYCVKGTDKKDIAEKEARLKSFMEQIVDEFKGTVL